MRELKRNDIFKMALPCRSITGYRKASPACAGADDTAHALFCSFGFYPASLCGFCSLCFGYLLLFGRSKEGRGSSKGASSWLVILVKGMKEKGASVSGLKLSVGFTFSNEGFRMYIPIRISSPMGE